MSSNTIERSTFPPQNSTSIRGRGGYVGGGRGRGRGGAFSPSYGGFGLIHRAQLRYTPYRPNSRFGLVYFCLIPDNSFINHYDTLARELRISHQLQQHMVVHSASLPMLNSNKLRNKGQNIASSLKSSIQLAIRIPPRIPSTRSDHFSWIV